MSAKRSGGKGKQAGRSSQNSSSVALFGILDSIISITLFWVLIGAYKYGVSLNRQLEVANFSSLWEIAFGLGAVMFIFDVNPHIQQCLKELSEFATEPGLTQKTRDTAKRRTGLLRLGAVFLGIASFGTAIGSLYLLFRIGIDPTGFKLRAEYLVLSLAAMCIVLPVYFLRYFYRVSTAVEHLRQIDVQLRRRGLK